MIIAIKSQFKAISFFYQRGVANLRCSKLNFLLSSAKQHDLLQSVSISYLCHRA